MRIKVLIYFLIILFFLSLFNINSHAQPEIKLYTKQDVKLYAGPELEGKILENIYAKATVTIIGETENLVLVKSATGHQGWLDKKWLSSEPPAWKKTRRVPGYCKNINETGEIHNITELVEYTNKKLISKNIQYYASTNEIRNTVKNYCKNTPWADNFNIEYHLDNIVETLSKVGM